MSIKFLSVLLQGNGFLWQLRFSPLISDNHNITEIIHPMWKSLVWPHYVTKRGWANKTSLTSHIFIAVSIPSMELDRSCICVYWYRACLFLRLWDLIFGIVNCFVFYFNTKYNIHKVQKCIYIYNLWHFSRENMFV